VRQSVAQSQQISCACEPYTTVTIRSAANYLQTDNDDLQVPVRSGAALPTCRRMLCSFSTKRSNATPTQSYRTKTKRKQSLARY